MRLAEANRGHEDTFQGPEAQQAALARNLDNGTIQYGPGGPDRSGGEGRALCSRGELSPVLPSAPRRMVWHRDHKALRAEGATDRTDREERAAGSYSDLRPAQTTYPGVLGPADRAAVIDLVRSGLGRVSESDEEVVNIVLGLSQNLAGAGAGEVVLEGTEPWLSTMPEMRRVMGLAMRCSGRIRLDAARAACTALSSLHQPNF